ncbi:unnamed protein product, partial [Brenthis ino]
MSDDEIQQSGSVRTIPRNTPRDKCDGGNPESNEGVLLHNASYQRVCPLCLEMNRILFKTETEGELTKNIQRLHEKIKNLCFSFVKAKLLTKEKQQNYYAEQLKVLPFNLAETLTNDSKPLYQYQKHWYFRSPKNKDFREPKKV